MRYFTIPRIKKWCERKDISNLIDALNSKDSEIRKASILCLGTFGDAVALESLEFVLKHDPDTFVRINAQNAINNIYKIGKDSRIKLEPYNHKNIAYQVNIS